MASSFRRSYLGSPEGLPDVRLLRRMLAFNLRLGEFVPDRNMLVFLVFEANRVPGGTALKLVLVQSGVFTISTVAHEKFKY